MRIKYVVNALIRNGGPKYRYGSQRIIQSFSIKYNVRVSLTSYNFRVITEVLNFGLMELEFTKNTVFMGFANKKSWSGKKYELIIRFCY